MLSSHGDMGTSDTGVADPASSEMTRVTSTLPHQPLLSPSGIHLNNMGSQHQQPPSPSAMWPQVSQSFSPYPHVRQTQPGGQSLWCPILPPTFILYVLYTFHKG
jgi:hypothetical protein